MPTSNTFKTELLSAAKALSSKVDGQSPRLVTLTEGEDPRMQTAARIITDVGVARVKLLFNCAPNDSLRSQLNGIEIVDVPNSPNLGNYSRSLLEIRKSKGLTAEDAQNLVKSSLTYGALELRHGTCDAAVSGAVNTTSDVIRAGIQIVGKSKSTNIVSSFFLMILPSGRKLTYADCGVVPNPSSEELANIACSAAKSHQQLTGEIPLVALLSFSTLGSAQHESVEKIRKALSLARKLDPELIIDGEMQFDAAFVPNVAQLKAPNSPVAGKANVLIFPDLNSGNIAYKVTERLASATALGPILQGLNKPWMDLSRGCNAEDIVQVAAIACILAT